MTTTLSDRELQVLKLFGAGLSGPEVKKAISAGGPLLSAKTMSTYVTRLKMKIALEEGLDPAKVNMPIAVLWGMRMGLIPTFKFPKEDPALEMAYILATQGNTETVKVEKGSDGVITIRITPQSKKEA